MNIALILPRLVSLSRSPILPFDLPQNIEECLRSDTARLMFANSEFLMLFNQAATDRAELSNLLHISDTQMGYVTDVEPGHGLMRVSGAVIPFDCTIPLQS